MKPDALAANVLTRQHRTHSRASASVTVRDWWKVEVLEITHRQLLLGVAAGHTGPRRQLLPVREVTGYSGGQRGLDIRMIDRMIDLYFL